MKHILHISRALDDIRRGSLVLPLPIYKRGGRKGTKKQPLAPAPNAGQLSAKREKSDTAACPSRACTTRVGPREQAFSRPASRCAGQC